jgi:hypothetical protein
MVDRFSGSPDAAATTLAFCRSEKGGVVEAKVRDPIGADAELRTQALTASTLIVIESSSQLQNERSPFPRPRRDGIAQA